MRRLGGRGQVCSRFTGHAPRAPRPQGSPRTPSTPPTPSTPYVLYRLVDSGKKDIKKEATWLVSNITAGSRAQIDAVCALAQTRGLVAAEIVASSVSVRVHVHKRRLLVAHPLKQK